MYSLIVLILGLLFYCPSFAVVLRLLVMARSDAQNINPILVKISGHKKTQTTISQTIRHLSLKVQLNFVQHTVNRDTVVSAAAAAAACGWRRKESTGWFPNIRAVQVHFKNKCKKMAKKQVFSWDWARPETRPPCRVRQGWRCGHVDVWTNMSSHTAVTLQFTVESGSLQKCFKMKRLQKNGWNCS